MSENYKVKNSVGKIIKFFLYSFIGIFMFFIPIELNGEATIPIDHIVNFIKDLPYYELIYGGLIIIIGGFLPFATKTWNKDRITIVFSLFKLLAIFIIFMTIFNIGPEEFHKPDMLPFVYENIVIPVTTIIPIGSIFLAFLMNYGLMEFLEVLLRPIMKPIWKTPGRSAVEAVTALVGSYSLAHLITNRVYNEGKYTDKEASIIATGFSTVSVIIIIIVAKTLNIMEYWNLFLGLSLVVTFLVTAITARIYPLRRKSNISYYDDFNDKNLQKKVNPFKKAWQEAMKTLDNSAPILENILINLKDGIILALSVGPLIMSIGFIGIVMAKYTAIFDLLGYIFYPFTLFLRIPEPFLVAKASALSIAEMLLPAIVAVEAPLITRFTVGIVSVSEILFFAGSIPCILSTNIPLTLKDLVIIWIERVILSLLIIAPILHIIF